MFLKPIFPKAEFAQRYERARDVMDDLNIDALIAYSPGNVFWLSGFDYDSGNLRHIPNFVNFAFPKALLPRQGDLVLVGVNVGEESYKHQTWANDLRLYSFHKSRASVFQETVKDLKLNGKRIGIDVDEYGSLSAIEYENLRRMLPDVEFTDATMAFHKLRMIKTEHEISYLRTAAEVQNRAYNRFLDKVTFGYSETRLIDTMFQCQFESGGTEPGFALPWSHPEYMWCRASYPDRILKRGDFLFFDCGSSYRGYKSDFNRFFMFGEPTPEFESAIKVMTAAYEEGLELWKPYTTIGQIAEGLQKIFKKHGLRNPFEPTWFIGHNLGHDVVEAPWYGTWEPGQKILPYSVLAIEYFMPVPFSKAPVLYEEDFIVREEGLERLSEFPNILHVVDKK